jgi:hypothetical protein
MAKHFHSLFIFIILCLSLCCCWASAINYKCHLDAYKLLINILNDFIQRNVMEPVISRGSYSSSAFALSHTITQKVVNEIKIKLLHKTGSHINEYSSSKDEFLFIQNHRLYLSTRELNVSTLQFIRFFLLLVSSFFIVCCDSHKSDIYCLSRSFLLC